MQFINKRRAMAQRQSGFTLIELLVVIAILGILAGVVVFAIGGVTDNGQASACKLEARTVRTAVQAYRAQNSAYPATQAALENGVFLDSTPKLVAYTLTAGVPTYAWTSGAGFDGAKCSAITPAITP